MFQNRKNKELEEFSLLLERMIGGEKLHIPEAYEDTLPSKIRHQLVRLSENISANEEALLNDRNQIRELIAEIAHQMRNPLANMESYLALLSHASDDTEREEYLKALQQSEQNLRFLTESFIKMARLENRIIQIRKDDIPLHGTLLKSILSARNAADEKHIFISLQMNEELCVPHDPNWLCEAVYNLLDNSIKYSPPESEILLSVLQNEMYTRITVRDFGAGIYEDEENRIFQRFYRGRASGNTAGFGLGLYLAREIVLMHGGFMKARRKNPGLEMNISLP